MKITETRKDIIELIEPYMDKSKSQFALVTHEKYDWEIQQLEITLDNYTDWFIKDCKVIWHYDITAVLKYIEKKWYWIEFDCLTNEADCYFMIKDDVWYDANLIWTFPNKPLHLYDTNDDEQLLDLLLKLK